MHTEMGSHKEMVPWSNESSPVREAKSSPSELMSASVPKSGNDC